MEELRGRERDVLIGDAEDMPCVRLTREQEVSVRVDDTLGTTGRARAVQPECDVIAQRVDRLELLRRLELVDEQQLRRTHLLCAHRIDDRQPRTAVLDEVGVVVGPVQRVDGYGHGSDPHRPEECGREPGVVVHDEEHALAALDAEVTKRGACAARSGEQVAVRQSLVLTEDRRLVVAPRLEVAIEQEAGVVALGDRDRGHAHGRRLTGQSVTAQAMPSSGRADAGTWSQRRFSSSTNSPSFTTSSVWFTTSTLCTMIPRSGFELGRSSLTSLRRGSCRRSEPAR